LQHPFSRLLETLQDVAVFPVSQRDADLILHLPAPRLPVSALRALAPVILRL
jgi:hypothetical protein